MITISISHTGMTIQDQDTSDYSLNQYVKIDGITYKVTSITYPDYCPSSHALYLRGTDPSENKRHVKGDANLFIKLLLSVTEVAVKDCYDSDYRIALNVVNDDCHTS